MRDPSSAAHHSSPARPLEPLASANRRSRLVGLLNHGCRLGEAVGLLDLELDEAAILEQTIHKTGLQDFGGDEFEEPLRRLFESCRNEASLNAIGRLALRYDAGQLLINRLHLTRARAQKPGIAAQRIERPLFITGLPRTGTTLLHNLLAQDPANRGPLTWEVMHPVVESEKAKARRIAQARREIAWFHRLTPGFQAIHAVDPELPQECVVLMSHSFLSDQFETMYRIPSYVRWLEEQDFRPAYEWHRRILQHLQDRAPGRQWVMKAPAHMQSLGALLEYYPDARIIQTHREPTEVLASLASLTAALRGVFSDSVDRAEIGRELGPYWAITLERFQAAREKHPRDQFLDVTMRELKDAPIDAVQKVYAWLGRELTPEAEARMRGFLAAHPRREHGPHRYSLGQFGLEQAEEHARFGAYRERLSRLAAGS